MATDELVEAAEMVLNALTIHEAATTQNTPDLTRAEALRKATGEVDATATLQYVHGLVKQATLPMVGDLAMLVARLACNKESRASR